MAAVAPEVEKKEEGEAAEQVVNPWEVSAGKGGIDYDKLVDQFGCQRLDAALVDRVARLTARPPHGFLRRGLFFAHRYLQDAFKVPLVIQLTDDEKFLWKNLTVEESKRFARECFIRLVHQFWWFGRTFWWFFVYEVKDDEAIRTVKSLVVLDSIKIQGLSTSALACCFLSSAFSRLTAARFASHLWQFWTASRFKACPPVHRMAQFHLLDPYYEENHRGRLTAEGRELPILRPRTHDGFLDIRYDERYTPFLERAGLDAISYQVRRGLPTLNPPTITALADRWRLETHSFHLPFGEMTITLEDSQKMLGVTIHGRPIIGPCVPTGWRSRVEAFLGRELPPEAGLRTSGVPITWLRQSFAECPEGADEQTVA